MVAYAVGYQDVKWGRRLSAAWYSALDNFYGLALPTDPLAADARLRKFLILSIQEEEAVNAAQCLP